MVAIKSMEKLPNCCFECECGLFSPAVAYTYCILTGRLCNLEFYERQVDCPLVEINDGND